MACIIFMFILVFKKKIVEIPHLLWIVINKFIFDNWGFPTVGIYSERIKSTKEGQQTASQIRDSPGGKPKAPVRGSTSIWTPPTMMCSCSFARSRGAKCGDMDFVHPDLHGDYWSNKGGRITPNKGTQRQTLPWIRQMDTSIGFFTGFHSIHTTTLSTWT